MAKIGTVLGLVVAALVITMLFRWLRDRVAGPRGRFSADGSGDDVAPGAHVSHRPHHNAAVSDFGGSTGAAEGGVD
jgi:hypothetical protein